MFIAMVLAPLYKKFGIDWVQAATMQAISGAGYPGVSAMDILGNVVPYIGGEEDKVETESQKILGTIDNNQIKDADFIILTYKDNEGLDDGIVQQIEKNRLKAATSSYWANWWKVYGLGELGQLQGAVFTNYKIIDKIPQDARLIGIGLDFGYTNDPSAIIEVYKHNETRILNEVKYQTGMLNSDIAKVLPKSIPVYADSAEPKSIADIQRYGITIKGVTKGRDSVNYGIDVMQAQSYLVTSSSTNLIKELRSYCWDVDKAGKRLNKPIENFNHALDAVRYHEMETLGMNKNYGSYNIL